MTYQTRWLASAALALGLLLALAPGASAFALNDLILNGGFGTDPSGSLTNWTVSSATNVTARGSADAINTTTGNAGFNSFFTSSFGVLGDQTGAIVAGDTPNSGTSTLSQSFTLPIFFGTDLVQSYNITLSFKSVFDGDDSETAIHDAFTVTLQRTDIGAQPIITLLSENSTALPSCGPDASPTCTDSQIVHNPFTASGGSLNNLVPGATYTLVFQLSETSTAGPTNVTDTAVGVDDVDIDAEGFLLASGPSTLLTVALGLAALGGAAHFRRRRVAA